MISKKCIQKLEKFRNQNDKFDSLFTFIIHDLTVDELISKVKHRLEIINKIKDSFKKKYLNDRLYCFVEFLEKYNNDGPINSIFLVGPNIEEVPLTKQHRLVLNDYNVKSFLFKSNNFFEIDYVNELLNDLKFKQAIKVDNKVFNHIELNSSKSRIIKSDTASEEAIRNYIRDNIKEKCVIYGVSSAMKNLKFDGDEHQVVNKNLTDEEVKDIFKRDEILNNHKSLEEVIGYLNNENMMNRVIVGKDIGKAIKNYMVKKVYLTTEMLEKVKQLPTEYLNFEMVLIEGIQPGDIHDTLKEDYSGIVGYTYY